MRFAEPPIFLCSQPSPDCTVSDWLLGLMSVSLLEVGFCEYELYPFLKMELLCGTVVRMQKDLPCRDGTVRWLSWHWLQRQDTGAHAVSSRIFRICSKTKFFV